jgi:hypothetical protein
MDPVPLNAAEASSAQTAFAAGAATLAQAPAAAAPAVAPVVPTDKGVLPSAAPQPAPTPEGDAAPEGDGKPVSTLAAIHAEAAAEQAVERQRALDAEADRLRREASAAATAAPAPQAEAIAQTLAALPQLLAGIKDVVVDDPSVTEGATPGKSTVGEIMQGYPAIAQSMMALIQAAVPQLLARELGHTVMPTINAFHQQQTAAKVDTLMGALDEAGHTDIRDLYADDAKWGEIQAFADGDPVLKRYFDSDDAGKLDKVLQAWRESKGEAMPAAVAKVRSTNDAQRQRTAALHGGTLRNRQGAAPAGNQREPTAAEKQRLFDVGQRGVTGQ